MGMEYYVHLGPVIQFKTNKIPQRTEEYEKFFCPNEKCKKYNKGITGGVSFCDKCGTAIKMEVETYQEDMDLFEFAEKMGISDEVNPDTAENEDGDTQLWFPNLNFNRNTVWDVKYQEVWEDLTNLDVKAEIEMVKKYCARAIEILEKEYGVKAEIKWGLTSTIS